MRYLVDGHNLIPKIGLRLDSFDDEEELIRLLREFARFSRREVEVYFDGAPVGHVGKQRRGAVTAHFVRAGQTADAAIRARLLQLGSEARHWVVVSSDHEVQNAARLNRAAVLSSEAFVQEMRAALRTAPKEKDEEGKLPPQEVEEWLKIFRDKGN